MIADSRRTATCRPTAAALTIMADSRVNGSTPTRAVSRAVLVANARLSAAAELGCL